MGVCACLCLCVYVWRGRERDRNFKLDEIAVQGDEVER